MQLSLMCAYRIGPKYIRWKLVFHQLSDLLLLKFAGRADFVLSISVTYFEFIVPAAVFFSKFRVVIAPLTI
jgi:hypothetical protein